MELRQLRHFVAVVDKGNLSRAADRVAISQPALTRSIKNLEETLGVELLERKPRGVVPTEAGVALYHHAKMVLNDCARLTTDVRAFQRGLSGTVQVGIAAMFASHIVDSVALELSAKQPGVSMVISQGFFEELVRELIDGRLDLMFSNFPAVAMPAEVTVETLYSVVSSIVVGDGHPLFKRRNIGKTDLVEQRWVVADQPHAKDFLEQFFARDGLPVPRAVVRTNSLGLMMSLLTSGQFITAMPEHLLAREFAARTVRRLPLSDGSVTRKAGLIYRSGGVERQAVQLFLAEVRAVCAAQVRAQTGVKT